MSKIKFNTDLVASGILRRIRSSTGIDTVSKSSKIRLISDIVSEEISNAAIVYNNTIESMYAEHAEGNDLDIKGAQYGIYRIIKESIPVNKQDYIIIIEPKIAGDDFSSSNNSIVIIPARSSMTVGNVFKMTLTEDVVMNPGENKVGVSAVIESVSDSGFSISEGKVLKIATLSSVIGLSTNSLQVRVAKAIAVVGRRESDNEFRQRIIIEKAKKRFNSIPYIRGLFSDKFGVAGVSISTNMRGSATMDIGFVTKKLIEERQDDNISALLGFMKSKILEVTTPGTDLDIYVPEGMKLTINYRTNSADTRQTVDSILLAFSERYRYSEINSVSLSSIESEARSLSRDDSLELYLGTITDLRLGVDIYASSVDIICPKKHFLHLDSQDIIKGA